MTNNVRRYLPFTTGASLDDDEYWDPRNDPANWQHMTSFFVGLGLGPTLNNPNWEGSTFAGSTTAPFTGYPAFVNGATWPTSGSNRSPGNVYDMWHGAINSRGEFFSADTPEALVDAFRRIRNRIDQQSGAVSSAAGTSLQVQTDSAVFAATYNSNKWEGELVSYKVNADGSVQSTPRWSTNTTYNHLGAGAWASNNKVLARSSGGGLLTFNPTNKTSLPAAMQTSLASQASALGVSVDELIQWILGNNDNALLRKRDHLMGDLLNSAPVFEGGRDYGYVETMWNDTPRIDGQVYAEYLKKKGDAGQPGFKPTVYVGSNDGMLHAFNADTGVRRFSFIPTPALQKIGERASPTYSHDYYVDGPITLHDVHNGSEWRTILVASTGAGARGLFALDVTNPDAPLLLWEYFPTDDDLGYVLGEPVIARAENGDWVVVFGNGVGSESNDAYLYVLDAFTGSLKKKVKAGNHVSSSANGLSAPALLYMAGKRLQFAYAGDLQGNLWRFEVSSNPSSYRLDFGNKPILEAKGPSGAPQPITAKPRVASDRILGRMIIVGTGKLIELTDKNNTEVQTLYGVFDRASGGSAKRGTMTAQTITSQSATNRTISSNALSTTSDGWYSGPDRATRNSGRTDHAARGLCAGAVVDPGLVDPRRGRRLRCLDAELDHGDVAIQWFGHDAFRRGRRRRQRQQRLPGGRHDGGALGHAQGCQGLADVLEAGGRRRIGRHHEGLEQSLGMATDQMTEGGMAGHRQHWERRGSMQSMYGRETGFTLLELMITLVVLAIVSAVAIPSYSDYVKRAARADAQLVLMEAAQYLERKYSECNSYILTDASTVPPCTTSVTVLPTSLRRSPKEGQRKYRILMTRLWDQQYILRARPDKSDECGQFEIRSNGLRRVVGASLPSSQCWRR
ncbi:MAG: PilC/PilY family type IV pilus protein [Burkholderiaceae bacterium]